LCWLGTCRAFRATRYRDPFASRAGCAAPPPKAARKPRRPTLASDAKQARAAGIDIARIEMRPDGTVVIVTGKPDSAEPKDAWPLDEFRTKETKQ